MGTVQWLYPFEKVIIFKAKELTSLSEINSGCTQWAISGVME